MEQGQETTLEQFVASSTSGVAILDDVGQVIYANPAFVVQLRLDGASSRDKEGSFEGWLHSATAQERPEAERRLLDPQASSVVFHVDKIQTVRLYLEARRNGRRLVVSAVGWPSPESVLRDSMDQSDALTGVGNRRLYDECIQAWIEAEQMPPGTAAILLDLDRFKQVNDTLGHDTGDGLLRLAAKRMRSAIRGSDTLIRLGGDEFVILQEQTAQPQGAQAVAARLVELLQRPFLIEGHQVNSGASVGVAVLGQGTDDARDLLRHADLALYEAKRQGRSRFCFFEPWLEERAQTRRLLEMDLRRALGLRQFSLVYQPQQAIMQGCICGFEALIRWDHPQRGRVSPVDFIPLAEEIGEINAIGEWVIHTACTQAVLWPRELSVAVNVSPIQFNDDNIVTIVEEALARSGLPAHRLELEITESTLMNDSEEIMQRLWKLKDMGVGIAMDDFGTGYASLSYLNSFPFTKLKIDRSFLQQAEQSPRAKALMSAILGMGKSLGMLTIAEGVETSTQYEELTHGGCSTAQGFFIAKPMAANTIEAYLATFPKT